MHSELACVINKILKSFQCSDHLRDLDVLLNIYKPHFLLGNFKNNYATILGLLRLKWNKGYEIM